MRLAGGVSHRNKPQRGIRPGRGGGMGMSYQLSGTPRLTIVREAERTRAVVAPSGRHVFEFDEHPDTGRLLAATILPDLGLGFAIEVHTDSYGRGGGILDEREFDVRVFGPRHR